MNILVIDVGGSHVKVLATGEREERKFVSGPELTAQQMVDGVKQITHDWQYDAISIGYPGPVLQGRPTAEPVNLGKGWESFDFAVAFGKPVKVINDAAMQALGSYEGGKMLFLGLGTGLGTAMVVAGRVYPMELGHLPYCKATFEDYVGDRGLARLGTKKWRRRVADVTAMLQAGLQCEYVVLGGGNVRKLKTLPPGCRAGSNENAFTGGFRLWETAPAADRGPPPTVPDGKMAGSVQGSNGNPNSSEASPSEAARAADSRSTSAH